MTTQYNQTFQIAPNHNKKATNYISGFALLTATGLLGNIEDLLQHYNFYFKIWLNIL